MRWLDLAAPIERCLACDSPKDVADGLCLSCREVAGSFLLGAEQGPPPEGLTLAVAAFAYRGCVRGAIRSMKFRGEARRMAEFLAPPMIRLARECGLTADAIVPVPLSKKRLRERGYNQSTELAARLGRALGIPVREALLWRTRATRPQSSLSGADRAANVQGAFRADAGVRGKHILLLDDIITTGNTIAACSAALLAAGAAQVDGIFAARALLEEDLEAAGLQNS